MANTKFITNEPGQTLQERFALRIKNTQFFDVLSGYFYSSGFKAIYPSLENTKKIRILVGISTDNTTNKAVKSAELSSREVGKVYASSVKKEFEDAEDSIGTEESVHKFKEWLQSGRIEIKAYKEEKIHSKVYIMTADEQTKSFTKGSVITGSSNFTESGLRGNIEFNVELKDEADYDYALGEFEKLWAKGVPVREEYEQTIDQETWLNDKVTPYKLYLKFLYEYFREELNENETLTNLNRPPNFVPLKYQEDAVINAKRIVNKHGGVFISDVVGLGKTYMGTMLCQELGGRTLVIAPPNLIDENNPGSWKNAFTAFNFGLNECAFKSKGVIDQIAEKGQYKGYDNIVIDEAHNYRNESNDTYGHLRRICTDKKVILVTATPYNNKLEDLRSQIGLFQGLTNSTIPNLPNIQDFFTSLRSNLNGLTYKEDPKAFTKVSNENAKLLRTQLLKHIMVRRTRSEITNFYSQDLIKEKIAFPTIANPTPIYCKFTANENEVFYNTIEILKTLKYARYKPLTYLKDTSHLKSGEMNRENQISAFMKVLIVKRLESSFWAFKQTIDRFISYYESFIEQYETGQIIISKKNYEQIKDHIIEGDLEEVKKLIEDGKGDVYKAIDFNDDFIDDLIEDKEKLIEIRNQWKSITTDSKLIQFKQKLKEDKNLLKNKKIIFTESKETCDYLQRELESFSVCKGRVINFSGDSSKGKREEVINNFDDGVSIDNRKNDYDILITTDVLAEGVNLHRCNAIINYDLPWNPTKIMQRVGRINRLDTKQKILYSYNFFPTEQSDDEIFLKANAEAKISAFISLLGNDSQLLTDSESIESHTLFEKLNSKDSIEGDKSDIETELSFLREIKAVRDEDENLFEQIKKLPKKCRAARNSANKGLLTYHRAGGIDKFFFSSTQNETKDINDFIEAAKLLKVEPSEPIGLFDKSFYGLLTKNKEALDKSINELEEKINKPAIIRGDLKALLNEISTTDFVNCKKFTEIQEDYIQKLKNNIRNGSLAKSKAKAANIALNKNLTTDPLSCLNTLKTVIKDDDLTSSNNSRSNRYTSTREIILSEFYN